jgi:hypothetical protein
LHSGYAISNGRRWAGRIISGLLAVFFALDGAMKLVRPAPAMEAFVRSGWPASLSVTLGVVLLASTAVYLVPRTAILGAVLLTGYLGGAVATNLPLQNPIFSHTLFPVYFGVLLWLALWLRDERLRGVLASRERSSNWESRQEKAA